ncbi:MAG TPA: replication-relaxation family protein [Bryobacteraceae bacterium]|nr:replication-relaxation family protein [Bryobacteraceae bacterium]
MAGNDRKLVILQDRDMHLLRELAVMRVIDREQAKVVAGFHSTTRVNARLLALTQAGFLRRFFWGSVGSARKALYSLSPRGAEIVGVPDRGPRRRRDQVLAADFFSIHQLQVNELYCTLKYRPLPNGAKFVRWVSFQEPIAGTALIPDGYAEVGIAGKFLAVFFEVDLGTENRAAWQRKVQPYLSYAASGGFTREFHQPQFRTLVVTTSESRLTSLRVATAALTDKIFRFTTGERIKREGFWGNIWQRPTGNERQTLL